jgi:hypothetical protein
MKGNLLPFVKNFTGFLRSIKFLFVKFRVTCLPYGRWKIVPTVKPHIISLYLLLVWSRNIYYYIFGSFYNVGLFTFYLINNGLV